jgi:hypothetical protein
MRCGVEGRMKVFLQDMGLTLYLAIILVVTGYDSSKREKTAHYI